MMKNVGGIAESYIPLFLAEMVKTKGVVLHIASSDFKMRSVAEGLAFFAPEVKVLELPAWDTVPYDRVSPNVETLAKRVDTLSYLAAHRGENGAKKTPLVVLTTAAGAVGKLAPFDYFVHTSFVLEEGGEVDLEAFKAFLALNGYGRTDEVMEQGDYAVRGGIFDVFPVAAENPVRLDLFGDTIEKIRVFDAVTQTTIGTVAKVEFKPAAEVSLTPETISLFRQRYREAFGSMIAGDELYEAVSEGRRFLGMEQWLSFFYPSLSTIFDYVGEGALVTADFYTAAAVAARQEQIMDFYEARREGLAVLEKMKKHAGKVDSARAEGTGAEALEGSLAGGFKYRPVPPEQMFLLSKEYEAVLGSREGAVLSPFASPDSPDMKVVGVPSFSEARTDPDKDVFLEVGEFIKAKAKQGKQVFVAAFSKGSAERLKHLFGGRGIYFALADTWAKAAAEKSAKPVMIVLGIEHGFETDKIVLLSEQDILGEKLIARTKKRAAAKAKDFIADAAALTTGDLVVHAEHGVGRYEGLEVVVAGGAPHDCLVLTYEGGDRLYVPVENVDVLFRFGSEEASARLDSLGSSAWQARKSRLKARLKDMAEKLMKIAAARYVKTAAVLETPKEAYEEFAARFAYAETDDQQRSIDEVLSDLASGHPMDRLVCGDVGFGKTEVALRAAFVAAMAGKQVAVLAPTTILAKQHYDLFMERFRGLPLKIRQLSRLVKAKEAAAVRDEIADGQADIVVGTHSLLAKAVRFKRLGLIIVDEEQHFGVAMKERLKEMAETVHILTLTATPIPRTLQLALSGVREMSVIKTPPVDRLAVRTFVLPFDNVIIKEAILKEHFRGGQVFYVCPRVSDIEGEVSKLKELVPEIKIVAAHGQMSAAELEQKMLDFAARKYDVLVATSIIESGLDMPSVNTIIVHRADMFGLSQLYQLRGRVGRSKARAFAYLTIPADSAVITPNAVKRLELMQKLDGLGEGFNLASYDLDIRGAGNLLGEEQSGHIKEVGIELYQRMLEEAVAALKGGKDEAEEKWVVDVNIGIPVLIPEGYIEDLKVRLSFYRRLAELESLPEIEAMAGEMIDRFGALPSEAQNLFEIVAIKCLCRAANVEKIDVGEKGAVITLKDGVFPQPEALLGFITSQVGTMKVRPDGKIVYMRSWKKDGEKLRGVRFLAETLAKLAKG